MKPCSHPVVLPRHPAIRFKDKSERSVLPFCLCTHCRRSERSVILLPLYALLQSFVARSALVPVQPVVIPETALSVDSSIDAPLQTDCHPACARFFSCSTVLGTRASCSSSADGTFTITVVAERCPLVEGRTVH